MKFGIFDHLEQFPNTTLPDLYKERLEFVKLCDEGGITGYHIAEHHGSELCVAPNQDTFLAAVAAVTTKLRIGPLVKCLPLHHPLDIIEEICILDNLSDGRVDFGVGRGIIAWEHLLYGHAWEEGRERFEEALGIIIKGFRTGKIDSEGCRFYDFPAVETSILPVQRPNPPIWYPGDPNDIGAKGMTCLVSGRVSAEIREKYLNGWNEHKGEPGRVDGPDQAPMIGGTEWVGIADTAEEGRDIAIRGRIGLSRRIRSSQENNARLIPADDLDNARARNTPVRADANDPAAEIRKQPMSGLAPSGTLQMVVDYFTQYAEEGNADYVAMMLETGDMTHLESMHTLELFCEHVIPAVEKVSQ